jgi:hypothetical protein
VATFQNSPITGISRSTLVSPSSQWKKDDLAAQLERKYMQEYVPIAVSEE